MTSEPTFDDVVRALDAARENVDDALRNLRQAQADAASVVLSLTHAKLVDQPSDLAASMATLKPADGTLSALFRELLEVSGRVRGIAGTQ